jgi:hypothetical protein
VEGGRGESSHVLPQLEMENAVVVKGRRSRSGHCSTRWLLHILRGQPISFRTPERFAPGCQTQEAIYAELGVLDGPQVIVPQGQGA